MFGWCCNDPSLCQITNIFMVATDDIITSIKGIWLSPNHGLKHRITS